MAAADLIAAERFDCITIDLSLGDRDGIELLRLIAASGTAPRIIVISGCEQRILSATIRMAQGAGLLELGLEALHLRGVEHRRFGGAAARGERVILPHLSRVARASDSIEGVALNRMSGAAWSRASIQATSRA